MREAVIVSYARTGLAKSGRGGFNHTAGHEHGGARHQPRGGQVGRRARGRRGRLPRQRRPRRGEPRPARRPARRAAGHHGRLHDPAPLLVGPERGRAGRELHQVRRRRRRRGRWRRVDHDARRRHGRLGQHRPEAPRDVPGDLHGDDRDRRHRGRALQGEPRVPGRVLPRVAAAHGQGPGQRPLRRRDRPDERPR